MKRSVLLAVWLSLVLSLLKGATPEAPPDTNLTSPETPSESGNETSAVTTVMPTSESTGATPETPPDTNLTSPETPSESGNETSAVTTVMPTSESTGATPETPPDTNLTSPETPSESGNETSAVTTVMPTSESTGATPETPPDTNLTSPETPSAATPTISPSTNVTSPETPSVDFCEGDSCGRNLATCISLKSNYTCECPYGFYYSNENCYRGKIFPATITVGTPYSDSLQAVNSAEYEKLYHNLSAFFKEAFKPLKDYMETVIVEIQPLKGSRNFVPVNVTVINLFSLNSAANDTSVNSTVQDAIQNGNMFHVSSYNVATPCAVYQCDTNTTECQGDMFPECKCKPGLEKTDWDDRSCSACSKSCSADAHKYCVNEEGVPKCRCMTNFKTDGENCAACPVGYSGEECNDNRELILIIVGTVFGAVILSLLVAVSVVSVRAKHKQNPEKRSLIKQGYSDINTSDDRPSIFPRVQTTSGHANPGYQPNNPYEMRSTNRDFPERNYDDLYEISREPKGFRMQSRY